MERRLVVMRHAKSDWSTDVPTDFDRPLNPRGRRDAPEMARRLAELGWGPDYVLLSPSARTRETWELMDAQLPPPMRVVCIDSFYLGGLDELCQGLRSVPTMARTVLAIGHNPGWQHVVAQWSGEPEEMKTANAALFTADSDSWESAAREDTPWQLLEVLRPRK